jgi:hypothetical protein
MARAIFAAFTLIFVALCGASARADVVDRSAAGFTVRTTVGVSASAQRLYQDLLNVGAWWDKDHTYRTGCCASPGRWGRCRNWPLPER